MATGNLLMLIPGTRFAVKKPEWVAQIKTFIKPQNDGTLQLDTTALRQWLMDQAQQLCDASTNTAAAQSVLNNTNFDYAIKVLERTIAPEHWSTRPDWPSASQANASGVDVGVLSSKLAELKTLSAELDGHYAPFFDTARLNTLVQNWMESVDARSGFPPTVLRVLENRFYIYTFVTDWDEESAPSPPSEMVEIDQNDSAEVVVEAPTPQRHIVGWRLYRSATGSQNAAFSLIADTQHPNAVLDANGQFRYFKAGVSLSLRAYEDKIKTAQLQEPCPSLSWAEPVADLRGLVGMPNGIMAGFSGNTVCFCEPYKPYAWPVEYQITTEHPIVGMACFGQTLVVGTQGAPYYISGADSASMSSQKMQVAQSCVSARSMISVDGGVIYASPDGLCLADGSGIRLITSALFTREDWQRLRPSSIHAAWHDGVYYFWWNNGTEQGCFALDWTQGKLTTLDLQASATFVDKLSDTLYVAAGDWIKAFNHGQSHRTGVWRSKIMVMPKHTGFAWLSVESDFSAPVKVLWYGDGKLRHTAVVQQRTPVRLPMGRWLEHELEVQSSARWNAITVAGSLAELQEIPS